MTPLQASDKLTLTVLEAAMLQLSAERQSNIYRTDPALVLSVRPIHPSFPNKYIYQSCCKKSIISSYSQTKTNGLVRSEFNVRLWKHHASLNLSCLAEQPVSRDSRTYMAVQSFCSAWTSFYCISISIFQFKMILNILQVSQKTSVTKSYNPDSKLSTTENPTH